MEVDLAIDARLVQRPPMLAAFLAVGLNGLMGQRPVAFHTGEALEPPGASGRKRSKLLQCRWEIAERFSIHSPAANCRPAPLVRWARMKEAHDLEEIRPDCPGLGSIPWSWIRWHCMRTQHYNRLPLCHRIQAKPGTDQRVQSR